MNHFSKHPVITPRTALLVAALTMLGAAPAHALVVLDTFGPADTAPGLTWSLYNPDPAAGGQSLAVPFNLVGAVTVDSILTSIDGTGVFSLRIVADAAGLPTGSVLFSTALSNPTANTLASGLGWSLAAGNYWLAAEATAGSNGGWKGGDQVGTQNWAFTFDAVNTAWNGTGPNDAPAARINVTAVPEPGTWALMLGGVALLAWQLRRRA